MPNLYLVRGLPGSGKSTLAAALLNGNQGVKCEADDYFVVDGVYTWSADKVHLAHKHCQLKTVLAMVYSADNIVVSNTFTTEKELKPYLKLAEEFNYKVTTLIVENRHGNTSIHGVPEETMTKMRNRFSVKL